jgi:cytochrome c-type biogenesis protein CcmH/NrfG
MSQAKSLAEEFEIPDSLLKEAVKLTSELLDGDQLDQAVTMAQGLVAADESNPQFRSLLANGYFRQREMKKALEVVDEGLKRAPNQNELSALRGKIRGAMGLR